MKTEKKAIREARKGAYNNIISAFHGAIKYHHGGFELFAQQYARNASTVRNSFNIHHDNTLSLDLFLQAIEHTRDPVGMNALCHLADGHFIADCDLCECQDLNASIIDLLANAGEAINECAVALADGNIDRNEAQSISGKLHALQAALNVAFSALGDAK